MENLHFENLSAKFCAQVFEIEQCSIGESWTVNQIQGLVDDKKAFARIGIVGDEVVCYYSFYNIVGEGNINNLAVKESCRGKGVGSMLIEDMIMTAKGAKISSLTLEVNENNAAAISLYKKFGFKSEGRRIKFYGGKYDAIIMWKRDI